ncbi:DUF3987 domain-containing protein [Sinorhizobium meliloti]|uniref:DUF3987 domain-containing protein n=1 Tax=Rhizobium meliloti TaxID=382 RepID=UPI000FDBD876|nr:DUF3987 domain-containing protein [Sinorhizobium meliloti]MDW9503082.1 DUF3987 domain-containing protein [Sinorhizobium meliloti]MDX0029692.1 DUF3987 domain-containing protein [Sinorhizobium meliloti]MDX0073234.1 DUF3987 domain-containing protein [Sinorhizobium meliloti]RVH66524.1 DUF3987 domain-containing protein [Sinorhizobium meliloti]RVK64565.1 DUF3987 domain-containing protein [Sinorhizobium meliloti]
MNSPANRLPDPTPAFDEAAIRTHVEMLHQLAAGIQGKFVVSTFFANPTGEDRYGGTISHHAVGDVDGMVDAVMAHASTPNVNCYVCPNLMRLNLERGKKGSESDVAAVLALVADLDDDTGRSGAMPIVSSCVVESSPGNYQCFLLLERPLSPGEAKPLARALKLAANADHCTVDMSHVWRIPGTLNWPNAKKLARGRPAEPVAVAIAEPWDGSLIDVDELRSTLEQWSSKESASGQLVTLGELPSVDDIEISETAAAMLSADDVGDRSEHAARVVEQLAFDGLTAEQACAAFLAASGDWFRRYETRDPIKDFERMWSKFGVPHAEEREAANRVSSGLMAKFATKNQVPTATNDNAPPTAGSPRPVDPWAQRKHPSLPTGLLPKVIEEYAVSQAEIMGVDAGGIAAAALAVCAAAIPDTITLRVKRHDDWEEAPRLWVALIGNPSAKKSPIISAATRPLRAIDDDMVRSYLDEKRAYDALDKAGKSEKPTPKQMRARIEDVTVEAAQEILRDSRNGVLLIRDELSGWFGSMEKYGSGKGAAADRSFWLQAFNGGSYSVNRVGRGVVAIDNLSVSMLGGIQPEPIRRIAADAADDGLLQRLFPICLGSSSVGLDVPPAAAVGQYSGLVRRLNGLQRPVQGGLAETSLKFDSAAQDLRHELSERHHEMQASWEILNKKLAAHIGKYDGLFARLCVVFHCIESTSPRPASVIPFDTARRVADFLHEFLFPHALAFYQNVLGLSDRHDAVLATAGWILTHRPEKITVRDVRRGDRTMRDLDDDQAAEVLRKLDAMSWLDPLPQVRKDSVSYTVVPAVYEEFEFRAAKEKERRERVRELIASAK